MLEEDVSIGQNNLYRELLDYANDTDKSFDFFPLKNSALVSLTGLSESGLKTARNRLVQLNLIDYKPGKKQVSNPKYRVIQLYTEYPKKSGSSSSGSDLNSSSGGSSRVAQGVAHKNLPLPNSDMTTTSLKDKKKKEPAAKAPDGLPYLEIIDYLNAKTGAKYKSTTQATQQKIKARFNEKYTLDDFKKVIDNMYNKWHGTKWADYLRPETLFGPKFDGYLNTTSLQTKSEFLDSDIPPDKQLDF